MKTINQTQNEHTLTGEQHPTRQTQKNRMRGARSHSFLSVLILLQMLLKIAVAGTLSDSSCQDAVFPQLFGSTKATGNEVVLGIDYHELLSTAVAVGYFSDKNLARNTSGGFNEAYTDLSYEKYPFINIYSEGDPSPSIRFFTITQSNWATDFNGEFLDVAVLQLDDLSLPAWTTPANFDQDTEFFFAVMGVESQSRRDGNLYIFLASKTDNYFNVTKHEFFKYSLPHPTEVTHTLPHLITFDYITDHSVLGYRPIVTLHYPLNENGSLQIGLIAPFETSPGSPYWQSQLEADYSSTNKLMWISSDLYGCGSMTIDTLNYLALFKFQFDSIGMVYQNYYALQVNTDDGWPEESSFVDFSDYYDIAGLTQFVLISYAPNQTKELKLTRIQDTYREVHQWIITFGLGPLSGETMPRPFAIRCNNHAGSATCLMVLQGTEVIAILLQPPMYCDEITGCDSILTIEEISQKFTLPFQMYDAYLHAPSSSSIESYLYAVGLTQFQWVDSHGNQSTNFYSRDTDNMYAFVSHLSSNHVNCDYANAETRDLDHDTNFQEIGLIYLLPPIEFDYNPSIDNNGDIFSVSAATTTIYQSVHTYSSDLIPTAWRSCVINSAGKVSIDGTDYYEQPTPDASTTVNAWILDGNVLLQSDEVNIQFYQPSDFSQQTASCMEQDILLEGIEMYWTDSTGTTQQLAKPDDSNDYCACGLSAKRCALEEVATQMQNSVESDLSTMPLSYWVKVAPTSKAILLDETIVLKYVTETLSAEQTFDYVGIEFKCYDNSNGDKCLNEEPEIISCDDSQFAPPSHITVYCNDETNLNFNAFSSDEIIRTLLDGEECKEYDCPINQMNHDQQPAVQIKCSDAAFDNNELLRRKIQETINGRIPEECAGEINIEQRITVQAEFLIFTSDDKDSVELADYQSTVTLIRYVDRNARHKVNLLARYDISCEQQQEQELSPEELILQQIDQSEGLIESNLATNTTEEIIYTLQELADRGETVVDSEYDLLSDVIAKIGTLDSVYNQTEYEEEMESNEDISIYAEYDQFGNIITEKGFYDEFGAWQDMTGFIADPAVVEAVNTLVERFITQNMTRIGEVAVNEREDFYSEEDAAWLSTFDIVAWLETKGITNTEENTRMVMKKLEEKHAVPQADIFSEKGRAILDFSRNIMPLDYDLLVEKYIWLYTQANRRNLDEDNEPNVEATERTRHLQARNSRINSIEQDQITETQKNVNLLQMTKSIKTELVPSSLMNLDKKSYNWTVNAIDESSIEFDFYFDNPSYISQDVQPDTMKVSFYNTPFYLIPQSDSKEMYAIQNGYQVTIVLPPQADKLSSQLNTESPLLTIIAANGWLTFLFGISMQPLFDLINQLQITALLPLTTIILPENAMRLFEVIMHIAAFDYFEMYNPGFTETQPYSYKFKWFGFDSVNFIEDLGTFLIFLITLLLIQSVIAIIIYMFTRNIEPWFKHQTLISTIRSTLSRTRWIKDHFYVVSVLNCLIRFMLEAYIEILIGVLISFKMFQIRPIWNNWDRFAVLVHFIGIAAVIGFFIFVCWFFIYGVVPLSMKKKAELKKHHKKPIEQADQEFQHNLSLNRLNKNAEKSPILQHFSTYFRGQQKKKEKEEIWLHKVNEDDYEVYAALLVNLKLHSRSASFQTVLFLVRRIIIVAIIFGLKDTKYTLLQMVIFMLCSLFVMIFECAVKPFKDLYQNFIQGFNEFTVLCVGYLVMEILFCGDSADMKLQVGLLIVTVILFGLIVNLILIVFFMLKGLRKKLLHCQQQCRLKKQSVKFANVRLRDQKHMKRIRRKAYAQFVVEKSLNLDKPPDQRPDESPSAEDLESMSSSSQSSLSQRSSSKSLTKFTMNTIAPAKAVHDLPNQILRQTYRQEEVSFSMLVLNDNQLRNQPDNGMNSEQNQSLSERSSESRASKAQNLMIIPAEFGEQQAERPDQNALLGCIPEALALVTNIQLIQPDQAILHSDSDVVQGLIKSRNSTRSDKVITQTAYEVPEEVPEVRIVEVFKAGVSDFSISDISMEDEENRKTSKFWKEPAPVSHRHPVIEISRFQQIQSHTERKIQAHHNVAQIQTNLLVQSDSDSNKQLVQAKDSDRKIVQQQRPRTTYMAANAGINRASHKANREKLIHDKATRDKAIHHDKATRDKAIHHDKATRDKTIRQYKATHDKAIYNNQDKVEDAERVIRERPSKETKNNELQQHQTDSKPLNYDPGKPGEERMKKIMIIFDKKNKTRWAKSVPKRSDSTKLKPRLN